MSEDCRLINRQCFLTTCKSTSRVWKLNILIFIGVVGTLSPEVGAFNLDLPPEYLPYYFSNDPQVAKECAQDPECPYKVTLRLTDLDLYISFLLIVHGFFEYTGSFGEESLLGIRGTM